MYRKGKMKSSTPEKTINKSPFEFIKFLVKELSMTEEGLLLYNNIVKKWNKMTRGESQCQ